MENNDSKVDYLKVIDQFNMLDIDQKLEIFGKLPSKAREDLINVILRPTEIIRRISEEEMFFTIKDLGEENAEKLIALTTGRQLLYLLDIDLWTRNDLDIRSCAKWIGILAGIGDDKMLQFIQVSDPELLCSILNRLIRVTLKNPDIDLTEQLDYLPPFTRDNHFFIDFLIPDAEEPVKDFLDCIFRYDSAYYMKLVQTLSVGWLPEYEDTAYRWRSARLADHGFPDLDEALDIYSLFNPALIRVSSNDCFFPDRVSDSENRKLLKYPIMVLSGANLFEQTINGIDDPELMDRITSELAHVANKVMVADGKNASSNGDLKSSLEKTASYINLAMEELVSRENVSAMDLMMFNHVEHLFRHAFTLIMKLQYEARVFLDKSDGGLENLGTPLAPLLKGLLGKRPVFDLGGKDSEGSRDFRFVSDLELIRNLIKMEAEAEHWEVL